MIKFNQLHYFIAVAEELSFTKAAENLQITQPPLTRQIQKLEMVLGFALFDRDKRKISLTPAGEFFLNKSYEIIDKTLAIKDEVKAISRGESGNITIGFTGAISFSLLPILIQSFQKSYPNVFITIKEMSTQEQIEMFKKNDLDIGILNMPYKFNSESIVIDEIHREDLVIALSKTHHLSNLNKVIKLSDLKNENFILTPSGSGGFHDTIINLCKSHGFTPHVSHYVNQLSTAVSFVASNMGVAILPSSIQFLTQKNIVYLPIESNSISYKSGIAWDKNNPSPIIKNFIDFVRGFKT